jgi:hypothetical protein
MNGRQMNSAKKTRKHRAPKVKIEGPTYSSRGRNRPSMGVVVMVMEDFLLFLPSFFFSSRGQERELFFFFLFSCERELSSVIAGRKCWVLGEKR